MKKEYVEPQYPLRSGRSPDASGKSGLWNRKKKLSCYEMRMIVPLHYVTKCAVDDIGAFAMLNGFDFPTVRSTCCGPRRCGPMGRRR